MPWPDEYDNLPLNVDEGVGPGGEKIAGTHWKASVVNPRVGAINAIETELGLNPRGTHATVRARLDAIEGSTGPHDINGAAHTGTPLTAAKGGTGNDAYTDGEFLEYDGTAGKIQSAGCGPASFDAAGAAAAAVSAHEGAADPHAGYQKESEKGLASGYAALDAGGKVPTTQLPDSLATDAEVASAIATHEAAADPHSGYQRESEKGAASGYASLDANAKVVEDPAAAATTAGVDKIPKAGTGGTIDKDFVPVMVGASASVAGAKGLVPAPAAGDQEKVLSGAGTWVAQSSGGGDNVSVNGSACADVDLDDDGVTATAGRALMEWKTSGSSPTKINCQTPASVPVVLDREINTTIGTSWTAALTHAVPAGAMGTTRALRFTIYGWFANLSGTYGTISLQIKFGSTTLWEGTTISISSSTAYRSFCIQGVLVNANANNSQRLGGQMIFTTNTADPTTGYGSIGSGMSGGSFRGTSSESTTSAKTLLVNLKKTVSGTFDFTVDHALLELL